MTDIAPAPLKRLDVMAPQQTQYCVPLWLRDEQIKVNIKRPDVGRFVPEDAKSEPVAIVCYGPSLADTWERVREFKHIITCSGAHGFLVERGITPTHHVEVDPRAHKVKLIGPPQEGTRYLIASACHPAVFEHLKGFDVRLWHVFDPSETAAQTIPRGEWTILGGCSVGLRALAIAKALGFSDLHVFGMDGSEGRTGKHAGAHPNQDPRQFEVECEGQKFITTPVFLEGARQTWHELDQLQPIRATFHGDGLVQAMARSYVPKGPRGPFKHIDSVTITPSYAKLNADLHASNLAYGVGGGRHAEMVAKMAESMKAESVLDYGCGKGMLAKALKFPIWEYDPAIPEKSTPPRPADLVVCTDVLEHVEPETLDAVMRDLKRVTLKVALVVVHTGPAAKFLADGRNAHLIQKPGKWWERKLRKRFDVNKSWTVGAEWWAVLARKAVKHGGA